MRLWKPEKLKVEGQCSPKSGFDRKRSAHWVVVQCSCTVVHLCRLKQIRSGQHISLSSEQLSMFVQCVQCVQYMLFSYPAGWECLTDPECYMLLLNFLLFTFTFLLFSIYVWTVQSKVYVVYLIRLRGGALPACLLRFRGEQGNSWKLTLDWIWLRKYFNLIEEKIFLFKCPRYQVTPNKFTMAVFWNCHTNFAIIVFVFALKLLYKLWNHIVFIFPQRSPNHLH